MTSRLVMIPHCAVWVEDPQDKEEQVQHLTSGMITAAAKLSVRLEGDIK
jgi:hypothetical protein